MLKGLQSMLLLLGRSVPLLLTRTVTSCPSALPKPSWISSVLIKLGQINGAPHISLFSSASGQNTGTMPERRPFVRLPTDVYPVNYGLCLRPDLIDFTFDGKLEAQVEVGSIRAPGCRHVGCCLSLSGRDFVM